MRSARKLQAVVGSRGKLLRLLEALHLPDGTECDVLVLPRAATERMKPRLRPAAPALRQLAGLWADRDDIVDAAEYSAEQRKKLAERRDRRP